MNSMYTIFDIIHDNIESIKKVVVYKFDAEFITNSFDDEFRQIDIEDIFDSVHEYRSRTVLSHFIINEILILIIY